MMKDIVLNKNLVEISRLARELDKFKRKELDEIALKYGIDTRPYVNTMWWSGYSPDRYQGCSKLETIFYIIREYFEKDRDKRW